MTGHLVMDAGVADGERKEEGIQVTHHVPDAELRSGLLVVTVGHDHTAGIRRAEGHESHVSSVPQQHTVLRPETHVIDDRRLQTSAKETDAALFMRQRT